MGHIRHSEAAEPSVLRSPLLPSISQGVAAMPPAEGFSVMLRLISAMITGVAICAADRPDGHPVKSCAQALAAALADLAERLGDCRLDDLTRLAEEVGARIWHVVAFQADRCLKADLTDLVLSVCQPVDLVQHNHLLAPPAEIN